MPSHTFTTTNAEALSSTDTTYYAAVCIIPRSGNAGAFRFDTSPVVTSSVGGIAVGPTGVDYFWVAIPGRPVRLTELYCAGAIGDVVDLITFPPVAILSPA